MRKYLSACIEIEETAAQIYRQMSESTQMPIPMRVVMQNLADDEEQHAMQLRFALRLPAGSAPLDKQFNRTPLQKLLARGKELLEITNQQDIDVRQSIDIGLELEQDFCQVHIGSCQGFQDLSMKKMFAALADDDKTHLQKLLDAKQKFL